MVSGLGRVPCRFGNGGGGLGYLGVIVIIYHTPMETRKSFFSYTKNSTSDHKPREFFHKLDGIGNNANIGIRGLLRENKKKNSVKCYRQRVLNPWTSDSKSNTLLSQLKSAICYLVQKGECWDLESEAQGFNTHGGG